MAQIVSKKERIMKPWNVLTSQTLKKLGERGQSIVEFVLLLTVVAGISYGFVAFMNRNLSRYWEYSANLIINDRPNGPKAVELE